MPLTEDLIKEFIPRLPAVGIHSSWNIGLCLYRECRGFQDKKRLSAICSLPSRLQDYGIAKCLQNQLLKETKGTTEGYIA